MKQPWLRLYTDILNTPKVQRLSGDLFKVWVNLLCIAKSEDSGGMLPSVDDCAYYLRQSAALTSAAMLALKEARLLDENPGGAYGIHHWEERQASAAFGWLRLYSELYNDPKVQRLSGDHFKKWINLLCIARNENDEGYLPANVDLAFYLRTSVEDAGETLTILKKAGLVETDAQGDRRVHGWTKRQYAADAVDSKALDRKRKERERKRIALAYELSTNNDAADVTPESRPVTDDVTPMSRVTDPDMSRPVTDHVTDDVTLMSRVTLSDVSRPVTDHVTDDVTLMSRVTLSDVSRPVTDHVTDDVTLMSRVTLSDVSRPVTAAELDTDIDTEKEKTRAREHGQHEGGPPLHESPENDPVILSELPHFKIVAYWFKIYNKLTGLTILPDERATLFAKELLGILGNNALLAHQAIDYYFDNWRDLWFAQKRMPRDTPPENRQWSFTFSSFVKNIQEILSLMQEVPANPKAAPERWSTGESFVPLEISDEERAKNKEKITELMQKFGVSKGFPKGLKVPAQA